MQSARISSEKRYSGSGAWAYGTGRSEGVFSLSCHSSAAHHRPTIEDSSAVTVPRTAQRTPYAGNARKFVRNPSLTQLIWNHPINFAPFCVCVCWSSIFRLPCTLAHLAATDTRTDVNWSSTSLRLRSERERANSNYVTDEFPFLYVLFCFWGIQVGGPMSFGLSNASHFTRSVLQDLVDNCKDNSYLFHMTLNLIHSCFKDIASHFVSSLFGFAFSLNINDY